MKRKLLQLAWLAAGLGLLVWVIVRAGPGQILDALRSSLDHPWLLAGAVGLSVSAQAVFLLKWHVMARRAGADLSLRQTLGVFSVVALVGTFTPGRAGELVVPLLMRGGGRLASVALVNRLLESTWTLTVGLVAAMLLLKGGSRLAQLWGVSAAMLVLVTVMAVLSRRRFTAAILGVARACLRPLSRWRPVRRILDLEERYAASLDRVYEANERLLRPVSFALFGALMLAIWLMVVLSSYLLIQATVPPGLTEITFLRVVAVVAASAVAISMSPIPAGVGFSEFTVVTLFSPVFLPYSLLSRLTDHTVVVALYFVGRLAGRPLTAPGDAAGAALATPARDE